MIQYEETVKFLFSQLPVYQKVGQAAVKKDLTNIIALTSFLGDPHEAYPSVHIAGTNGKGTTAHLIAAILQEQGYRVGLYTSPHYIDFRERIKINGQYITKQFVCSFVDRIRTQLPEVQPSFFEFSVAMAFDYFKQEEVEIAVIETGLGGRLDSTNIVHPLISVITNISLDHQSMLGDTEYAIAYEKAGIIKRKVPLVVGKYQPCCDQVFLKKAGALKAPVSFASLHWSADIQDSNVSIYSQQREELYELDIPNSIPFLYENIITTLESIHILKDLGCRISRKYIVSGIQNFTKISNYIGRWMILRKDPLVIADSAHNEESLKEVASYLSDHVGGSVFLILGFVKDKDVKRLLSLFNQENHFYLTKPGVIRGLPVDDLFDIARQLGLKAKTYPSVNVALKAVLRETKPHDLVFVGGSSFIVADVLKTFQLNFE